MHTKALWLPPQHSGTFRWAEQHSQKSLFGLQPSFPNCLKRVSPSGLNKSLGGRQGSGWEWVEVPGAAAQRQVCQGLRAARLVERGLGCSEPGLQCQGPTRTRLLQAFLASENTRALRRALAGLPARTSHAGRAPEAAGRAAGTSRPGWMSSAPRGTTSCSTGSRQQRQKPRPHKASHVNLENHLGDKSPCGLAPDSGCPQRWTESQAEPIWQLGGSGRPKPTRC